MSPVLGGPPRAPRSHPLKPGAQAPGAGKGATALGKTTGAPRAAGPNEARHTTRGHQARQRGTPPATTKAHEQVPSNNDYQVPQTRAARTTRNEPWHRNRCQAPPNPHTAHPSQKWRGTSGARTEAHTHSDTPAGSGGAQPKPEPKHTHPGQTRQPGVAGYKKSAHENTHTPTSRPGVAGHSRNPSPSRHIHTAHPSQEWRGTGGGRRQMQKHPGTPARSGGPRPKPEPRHTHPHCTPQAGVAGYKQSAHTRAHIPQSPSQEWRGTSGARTQAHTQPNTPARSGEAQPKPELKHTHSHRTPQPGVAGYRRSAHTSRHKPRDPGQEWRGAAETRT